MVALCRCALLLLTVEHQALSLKVPGSAGHLQSRPVASPSTQGQATQETRPSAAIAEAPPPWVTQVLAMTGHEKQVPTGLDASSLPPPPPAPTPLDALKAAIAARAAAAGIPVQGAQPVSAGAAAAPGAAVAPGAPGVAPPFVPMDVGAAFQPLAVPLAASHANMLYGPAPPPPPPVAPCPPPPPPPPGMVLAPAAPPPPVPLPPLPPTPTLPPRLGPPTPPKCSAAPSELKNEHVQTALAPNKPEGATAEAVHIRDGGLAWQLADGGWAFQYPKMALRMDKNGQNLRAAWAGEGGAPAYAVEYNEYGYQYHVGNTLVSHEANGDLVYHQPTGTVRQEGDLLTYHWCDPNIIVYQTPSGVVYYDDQGLTYQGDTGVAHYGANGDTLYQGAGGVTAQKPDGSVTHWTREGAIYHHPDGSMTYTPTGESHSHVLSPVELGPDPFPGAPLTVDQIIAMADALPADSAAAGGPAASPAAAVAPPPAAAGAAVAAPPFLSAAGAAAPQALAAPVVPSGLR